MNILFSIAKFQLIQILVFGVFFTGLLYFTIYDDGKQLELDIVNIQTKRTQIQTQIQKKQKEIDNIRKLETEILYQQKVVQEFLNFMPKNLTYTDVSALLLKEAKLSGVNIIDKKDTKIEKNDSSDYQKLIVNLKISGAFSQILLFLSKLTNQKRILVLTNIKMKIDKDLILADLVVDAYRYSPIKIQDNLLKK